MGFCVCYLTVISGQSVLPDSSHQLGVSLPVLTLLIFGYSDRFLVCMLIKQTRRLHILLAHSLLVLYRINVIFPLLIPRFITTQTITVHSQQLLSDPLAFVHCVLAEWLVEFSIDVQLSASPCLQLLSTTELWWRCQGRSDLRNSDCAWTPAIWTPSPPPAKLSSAPLW